MGKDPPPRPGALQLPQVVGREGVSSMCNALPGEKRLARKTGGFPLGHTHLPIEGRYRRQESSEPPPPPRASVRTGEGPSCLVWGGGKEC